MEKLIDQFINSYEKSLAKESKEICKEVESILGENDEFEVEKASSYCYFVRSKKREVYDSKLVDKCIKYLDNKTIYNRIKDILDFELRNKMV